jgi:uncharacterized protein YkwD
MKKKLRTILAALLLAVFCVNVSAVAYATSDAETAAADYLAEQGIYEGDENGNLNLDKTLTRAELAAILTRLDYVANSDSPEAGIKKWREWGVFHFAEPENRYNTFTDLPDWALPYVEYCYERGLVKGMSETKFDASGAVSPKTLCAVILRYCGIPETEWEYAEAVERAQSLGIAPDEGLDDAEVTRGVVALVIKGGIEYTAIKKDAALTEAPEATPTPQLTPAPSEVPATTIDEMKAEIVRLTNEEREKAGLNPLEVLPELMDCAQAKAQDMVDNHYFAHESPTYGTHNEMITAFVPQSGKQGGWENATKSKSGVYAAMRNWITSEKGHYDALVNPQCTYIGVGIADNGDGNLIYVQQFIAL